MTDQVVKAAEYGNGEVSRANGVLGWSINIDGRLHELTTKVVVISGPRSCTLSIAPSGGVWAKKTCWGATVLCVCVCVCVRETVKKKRII